MEHKDIRTAQTTGATSSCFRIGCSVGAHNESPSIEDYEPQTYTKEAFEVFEVLWLQRKLCDVEIEIAGEGSIKAHRIVLAALSPYFRAMFTSDLKESQMEKIPIHGVGFHTMGKIIKFAYTGRIKVEESNVCQLLPAANMLQVQHVSHACCRFLEHQLEPSNCIGIADFALQHGMMGLYSLASCFIEQHFPSVSRLEEFLSLPYGRLVTLLRKDELYVRCESEVFDAVVRWALHDEENRRMHLEPVLQAVRCHFLAPHFLQEQLRSCAIVRSHQRCCDYLSKVVQDLTVHRKYSCCHERCPSVPCVLYVAGGYLQRSLGAAECYSAATESWTVLPDLPIGRSGLASAFLAGRFYVAGGRVLRPPRELGDDTSAVHCYDPAQNEWIECKPMGVPRHRLAMGVLDGRLYAVAGSHGKDCLRSAERYDHEKDAWSPVASLMHPRFGLGVAVVRRLLYAIGGCNGSYKLSTVECYNPETDCWSTLTPMKIARSGAGVVSLGNRIYVIGGFDGRGQVNIVECYHTETDTWEMVAPLKTKRSALSAAVLDGKIYALGGFDGQEYLSSVEVYDPENDTWSTAPQMPTCKSGHASASSRAPCIAHGIT
ncbi:kelch-like ECH-associated protein 1 isoform X4 [Ornithodoros turicata]|uniref:kelch-like ECH-associated protein 1 isoform X4 n=1 Tax=Ornithodoros turicata TaxID=34597 RepID=UPI00313A37DA